MSRDDTYSDSCAIAMNKMAQRVQERMEREVGHEWDDRPDLCDLWRMYKFCADLEEAHSKMIHGNITTCNGVPDLVGDAATVIMPDNCREIMEEVTEINNKLKAFTNDWRQMMYRVTEITDFLRKNQDAKDTAERKAQQEKAERQEEVDGLRKAATLGFRLTLKAD